MLIFSAELDAGVSLSAQCQFAASAPNCSTLLLGGARHEVLFESDAIRGHAISMITAFLLKH